MAGPDPQRLRERLARLRREDARGVPAEREPRPGGDDRRSLPPGLRRQLQGHRRRSGAQQGLPAAGVGGAQESGGERSKGLPSRLERRPGPAGPSLARESVHAEDFLHGSWALGEVDGVAPQAFSLLTGDPALADLDPRQALYLDTETTGLAGGAGTYVFMVGLGRFEGGHFRTWQGFLESPADERALLAEVARRVRAAGSVVSFFGKSFDRHRLEDKMRIAGVPSPFVGRAHLDLYHPFRRLTRGLFNDTRLQTLERELLDLAREQDLPGSMAPEAWFDFVAGRSHRLEGVFQHNLLDVLSLATLTAHLGRALEEQRVGGGPLSGCPAQRAWVLARAYLERGARDAALPWLEHAVERALELGTPARPAQLARADCLRRLKQSAPARAQLEALAEEGADEYGLAALVSLAKLLEHDLGDFAGALRATERALELVHPGATGRTTGTLHEDLAHRRARLTERVRG